MKAISYFKMPENTNPATKHHIQEDVDPQLINNTYNKQRNLHAKYDLIAMMWLYNKTALPPPPTFPNF
jgi:hypothetical protein